MDDLAYCFFNQNERAQSGSELRVGDGRETGERGPPLGGGGGGGGGYTQILIIDSFTARL